MPDSIRFDRAVPYYDETRGLPPEQIDPWVDLIVEAGALDESSRMLEVGVGTGRAALPVSRRVGAVFGIDLSRPMMDHLRQKQTNEPVYVTEGNATQLPYRTRTFDAVLAIHVLHLIPNWQASLDEIGRVLTPEGRFLHGFTWVTLYELWDEISNRYDHITRPRHVGMNDHDELAAYLRANGWQPATQDIERTYPHPLPLRRFIRQVSARQHSWTWRADDDTIATVTEALTDILTERYGDLDRTIEAQGRYGVQAWTPPRR